MLPEPAKEIQSQLDEEELEKQYLIHRRKSMAKMKTNESVKVIDWKTTKMYEKCISTQAEGEAYEEFNPDHDKMYFTQSEIGKFYVSSVSIRLRHKNDPRTGKRFCESRLD